MSRLDALKSLVEQDPSSLFARYGLAQEYATAGDFESAVAQYEALLAANPDYVAAYYHGGQALENAGQADEARAMYQRGVEACARTGDLKTRSEIQAALDILG